ncbi:MAG: hypothetical protein HOL85_09070 [Rhodospirillaceae bacterium]|jgi:hypothetical protein|nr:hypothetical protein [Rhodospirillaceae bacterium]
MSGRARDIVRQAPAAIAPALLLVAAVLIGLRWWPVADEPIQERMTVVEQAKPEPKPEAKPETPSAMHSARAVRVILPPPPTASEPTASELSAPEKTVEMSALRPTPPVRTKPAEPKQVRALQPVATAKPAAVQSEAPSQIAIKPLRVKQIEPKDPASKPAASPNRVEFTKTVDAGRTTEREGRPLLRLLEHGSGPDIEIAWPKDPRESARLYRVLTRCHGVRIALALGNRLITNGGRPVDSDRVSGFMRRPTGRMLADERRDLSAIAARGGLDQAVPVRLFPRRFDARLLGGLRRLLGKDYRRGGTIHARYELEGGSVVISKVTADGRALDGRIVVPSPRRCEEA